MIEEHQSHEQNKKSSPATITVRVIKSFEYNNFRSLVFHGIDLHETKLAGLCDFVWERTLD